MIAAIYCRKSNEQNDRTDEERSIARQQEHARAFSARKDWSVAEEHVFTDDGISGAIFGEKRPGLYRLLNALKPRPPFQVLIVMDQSRLGRDQDEVPVVLRRLTQAEVKVYSYLTGTEITRSSSLEKFQSNANRVRGRDGEGASSAAHPRCHGPQGSPRARDGRGRVRVRQRSWR